MILQEQIEKSEKFIFKNDREYSCSHQYTGFKLAKSSSIKFQEALLM